MDTVKPITGRVVTVSGPNLSIQLQAAQDDPNVDHVKIEGGGSFTRPVVLRKHTIFDSSTYSIDITDAESIPPYKNIISVTDYGAFLLSDGVCVEGTYRPPKALDDYFKFGDGTNYKDPYLLKVQALTAEDLAGTGTTILEPTYTSGVTPAIEVFQALGDSHSSHTYHAANLAVIGFHIKGRQRSYDGGVRSTVLFGNCRRGLAMWNYLEDTGSIGITFGGSALPGRIQNPDGSITEFADNYANDVVCTRNIFSGVGAANSATINTENAYIFENYYRRLGHHEPQFGGGVCAHDHETNTGADHTKNIWIYNNLADYEDAAFDGVGSAFVAQDPYWNTTQGTHRGAVYIVNNVAIGGRDDTVHRWMSNGVYLVGIQDAKIINNYVFRTGQNAVQCYAIKNCLFQDNVFDSTGGGGNPTFWSDGMRDSVIRRNNFIIREGLLINMQAGFMEICGERNIYEDNSIPPDIENAQPTRRCP